jgi:EAL domain-containing protein (putative c-di-GMP-specific phosphodiesterase class I)
MRDVNKSISILTELKLMGVRLSIDDFGTGYSSFAYLAEFPVNTLKIDRSFILELTRSKAKRTIVKSIITMAHNLYLDVVAEGAEDNSQVALLKKMNCDKIQGYVYARPLDLKAFLKFAKTTQAKRTPPADAH